MYNISQIIASLQFVPRIANTHYYYQTYGNPAIIPPQKTSDIKGAPQIKTAQKKMQCDKNESTNSIAPTAAAPMTQPAATKVARKKYRKNVNKQALAQYFDNSDTIQESYPESQQWLADVIEDLSSMECLHKIVEHRNLDEYICKKFKEAISTKKAEKRKNIDTLNDMTIEFIVIQEIRNISFLNRHYNISPDTTHEQEYSTNAKINADILDKFEQRMQRVSQARGMKKMHDIHKLRQNQK